MLVVQNYLHVKACYAFNPLIKYSCYSGCVFRGLCLFLDYCIYLVDLKAVQSSAALDRLFSA